MQALVIDMHSVTTGTGTPILLIHGFAVDHRALLPLEHLFDRRPGWERTYVDLPGFGASPAGPETDSADSVAAALVEFVRDHIGRRRFAVLGSSFGGYLARHILAEMGDQVLGIALLAPVVRPGGDRTLPPKTVLRHDHDLLGSLDVDDAREYAEMAVIQSPDGWARFAESVLPGLRAHDPAAASRIRSRYSLSSVPEDKIRLFDRPGVMITGRQDHVVGFVDQVELLRHYSRMSYATLDGAGHNVHLDRPEETETLLSGWLDRMVSLRLD